MPILGLKMYEIYVPSYLVVYRQVCICSQYFELCFSISLAKLRYQAGQAKEN